MPTTQAEPGVTPNGSRSHQQASRPSPTPASRPTWRRVCSRKPPRISGRTRAEGGQPVGAAMASSESTATRTSSRPSAAFSAAGSPSSSWLDQRPAGPRRSRPANCRAIVVTAGT
ncbi:hypothetical protein ACFQ0T_18600 [Kitasatospora gansuensis]